MVEGKWFQMGQDIAPCIAIRSAVLAVEKDELDSESWNALIYTSGTPCATGRIRYRNGEFILEHLCVLPEYPKEIYLDVLVRLLLFKAQQHYANQVRLYCAPTQFPFYQAYGFTEDGDSLLIQGKAICLDTCTHCGKCHKPD